MCTVPTASGEAPARGGGGLTAGEGEHAVRRRGQRTLKLSILSRLGWMDGAPVKPEVAVRYAAAAVVAISAVWLRFWAGSRGANFDMESWQIVARLYGEGGVNAVYAGTYRYTYGPVWAHVLGLLGLVVGYDNGLRYALTGLLAIADLIIAGLLWRSQGFAAGAAYALCPVVILLSGYHRQHEPLALAILLGGLALYSSGEVQRSWKKRAGGLVILGLSLSCKHIAFAFPLWLARRQRGVWRLLCVVIPPAVFALMFIPHLAVWPSIRAHVIDYRSWQNFIAWGMLPQVLQQHVTPWQLFGGALVLGALFAPRDPVRALALYCLVLVASSPSIANQYLTLVGLAWAVYRRSLALSLAVVLSTIFIASDLNGFGIGDLRLWSPDPDVERLAVYRAIVLLLVAASVTVCRSPLSGRRSSGAACSAACGHAFAASPVDRNP